MGEQLKRFRHPQGVDLKAQPLIKRDRSGIDLKYLEPELAIAPLSGPLLRMVHQQRRQPPTAMVGRDVQQENVGVAITPHLINRVTHPQTCNG